MNNETYNNNAATAGNVAPTVQYQYSKNWRREGTIVAAQGERRRVQWTMEWYTGTDRETEFVRERTLDIRTWVNVARLECAR